MQSRDKEVCAAGDVRAGVQKSTSIQLSEYYGRHPRKAPFVRRDRPRDSALISPGSRRRDVAHGATNGARGAYPVNEIALAGARALASRAQQRAKGARGEKGKGEGGLQDPRVD